MKLEYIQDKLDEFDEKVNNTYEFFNATDGGGDLQYTINEIDIDGVRDFIQQSLTDYHNHIVEKVKERFESGEYEMEDGFSYENGIDLSEIPNELFIEFKGIKKGMLGITNYIKKDLIKLLNNI